MGLITKPLLGTFEMVRRRANGIESPSQDDERRPSFLGCIWVRLSAAD